MHELELKENGELPRIRRSYRPLWTLLSVALLPLLLAMLSYFGSIAVPEQRVNQGQLVDAQQPGFELNRPDGLPFDGQGRWQLLLVVSHCDQVCEQWQHQLKQLHTLLGKDRDRVRYQLVLPDKPPTARPPSVPATENLATRADLLWFSAQATPDNRGLWLLDPLGNRVLRYHLDQPPQAVLKDLKRLLKVSRIG
ncbi:hypothetical protein [Motiliproteus sp.]|uniref:hypothetical protein n=1 Tax=Motiliproteus sp. TaxID=1898955 RepID=UPI003BA97006